MFPIYPYLNVNDLNLDFLLRTVKTLETEIKNFVNFNKIKYADPLAWNITTQYESNTVVVDPANYVAYISKQPVPSGVSITNTDYWIVIFDLSFFIEGLTKGNIVLIGDSYGTKDGAYPGTETITDTLPEVIKTYLPADDAHFHYKYVNGAGFSNGGFLANLQSLESELDDTVTDIYVMGGWNDETTRPGLSEATVKAGMTDFAQYAKSKYPYAKIHLLFIASGVYKDVQTATPGDGYYSTGLLEAWRIYMQAGQWGFAYHNDAAYVLHNVDFIQDEGIHPNQTGVYELSKAIVSIIRGNVASYQYNVKTEGADWIAPTGTSNNCAANGTTLFEQITANGIHLDFYTETGATLINFDTATPIDMNGGAYEILDRMPKAALGYLNFLTIPMSFTIIDDNSQPYYYTGLLCIRPKAVYLIVPYIPGAGLAPITINASSIILGQGTTNCDEMYGI